jgi:hypothetical protein
MLAVHSFGPAEFRAFALSHFRDEIPPGELREK